MVASSAAMAGKGAQPNQASPRIQAMAPPSSSTMMDSHHAMDSRRTSP